MKKITLLIVFVALFLGVNQMYAQEVNEPANWPNSDWTVTGFFTNTGFSHNPSDNPYTTPVPGANFGYDNQAAGSGSLFDNINAESPTYNLRDATISTPPEEQVVVVFNYVYYQVGTALKLQYTIGGNIWVDWQDIQGNSTSEDYKTCSGLLSFESIPLLISTFSEGELQNFRYRIAYSDNQATFSLGGFCVGTPTLYSQETALCLPVSGINADSTPILDDQATISWTDNNGVTPQDGWQVEYGTTGYTQGTGTLNTSFTDQYTINGIEASTCYDVYVRALCDDDAGINGDWVGPFNFCTPIAVTGCGDMFYDIGGPNGDYSNNISSDVTTICPDDAGDVVTVIFDAFETESCCDWLKIYDGDSTAAPQIGPANGYRGTNSPGMISADIANGGCLTFEFHSDSSVVRDGWEARILCSLPITCFMPEDLGVNEASITIHETEVFWTDTNTDAGEPTSGWDIEYGPEGFEQGTGTVVNATTNPFTLTNLDAAIDYCYYVKANCGDNSGDEDSFWQGPVCFTTLCDIFPAPYSENFENTGEIPNCWNQGDANNEDWLFSNDVTAPGHIGNGGNVNGTTTLSGGYFAYVDDDAPNSLNTTLLSPFVDLTGIANPTLGFYYISHHEFLFQSVNFSIDIWDGTTWNEEVFTHTGNTTGWEQVFVDLTAYAGQTIQVKFIVDENSTSIFDDFAIDDVFIGEMPACVNVNSISLDNVGSVDATFTWNDGNNPEATDWQVVYGVPGFDPNTATPDDTMVNNAYLLDGLTDQTDYEVYIRANCGNGEFSLWAGPIAFTTLCPIFDAPYHEDFEDGGVLDACWTQSDGIESWQFATTPGNGNAAHVGDAGNVFGTTTVSGNYFAFIDDSTPQASNNAISTPIINVDALTSPTLYFYYVSHNEGSSNVSFSIDVWDGAAWNVDFYTSSSNSDNGWEQVILDLTGLNITGSIQVKFIVNEDNGTDFRDDFAIDDVEIKNAPDCWPIFDLTISNETATTVDIAWTDDDNDASPDTTYTIHYGPVGFSLGSTGDGIDSQDVTPFSNPFTLVDLEVDTDWDFYVVAHCPNGDSEVGPVQGTTLPTCLEVTGISQVSSTTTSVDVSWTDNNNPTLPVGGFDIEVTYPTFGQGTGQVTYGIGLDSATIDGTFVVEGVMIPSSTYEIYIRANCEVGDTDSSRWTGPFTINTQVGPPINDACVDAVELNVTVDCEPVLGNNIQATETAPDLATTCYDPALTGLPFAGYDFDVDDVWYKFIMPTTGTVLIRTGFAGVMEDSAIAVYKVDDTTDSCGSLVPAVSYFPNGNINYALSSCSDDDDFMENDANDNNRFSMVMVQNQTPGEEYYIRVWSVDRTNLTDTGGENTHGQFTICVVGQPAINRVVLDVDEETATTDVILDYYPNPVTNTLNLIGNTTIKAVSIYSLLGQEVSRKSFENISTEQNLDMSLLQSGTYFVKVLLDNDKTKTIKIIKN